MSKRMDARQIEREKLLFRYSSALQRGDFEVVEAVLLEAQHDPALDDLIAELNAAYEAELSAAHTILSPNHRYREDVSVNISVTRPAHSTMRMKPIPITLAAAIVAVVILGSLLLALRSGGQQPDNLAAIVQSLTSTNTPSSTPIPDWTPTPLPSVGEGTFFADLTRQATYASLATVCPPTLVPSATPFLAAIPRDNPTPSSTPIGLEQNPCVSLVFEPTVTPIALWQATPTAAYFRSGVAVLTVSIDNVPAGTLVQLNSAYYDGIQWHYQVSAPDGTPLEDVLESQLSAAAIIPLQATPTAALIHAGIAALSVTVGNIPAGTVVRLNSAYYTGTEWIYQISTMDNSISADVPEAWLVNIVTPANFIATPISGAGSFEPTAIAPFDFTPTSVPAISNLQPTLPPPFDFTPTPVPAGVDPQPGTILATFTPFPFGLVTYPDEVFQCRVRVYYAGDNYDVTLYTEPSENSLVTGTIPYYGYGTNEAGVLLQQIGADGHLWYFVVVQIENVVNISGWVSDLFVAPLTSCPAPANTSVQPTVTPPIIVASIGAPLCHVVNSSAATLRLRPEPSDSSTAISGFIAPHIGANVLAQQRDPANSAIYYLVTVQINDGSMLGWLNARDVLPVDTCPSPESNTGLPTVSVIAPLNVTPTTGVDVYTTQPIISNSYGGSVQVISAEFDGEQWTYQVQSYDPNTAPVTAQAYQLKYQYREQMPICNALNFSGNSLPIYAEPDPASVLVGTFSTQGGASFPVRDVQQGSDGQSWVQVRGSDYLGWMPAEGLSLIGSGCPQQPVVENALVTSTPIVPEPAIAIPTACLSDQIMNASVRLIEIYTDSTIASKVIGSLSPGDIATVMDSKVMSGGQNWLLISMVFPGGSTSGWIPDDDMVSLPCTPPETFEVTPVAASTMCQVVNLSSGPIQVRNEPTPTSFSIGVLPVGVVVDVVRQLRSDDGRIWFYVSAQMDAARVTGWVRGDTVTQIDTCPTLNDSVPTPVSP